MQLIRYEIRKLTSKRNLIVAILLLLFATFTFLYMEQLQSDDVMAKHKDVYFSINKQVNGKNLQDKKAWVEKKYTFYTQVKQYEEQRHLSDVYKRQVYKQILSSVCCNKSVSFVCVKPFYFTCTHISTSL